MEQRHWTLIQSANVILGTDAHDDTSSYWREMMRYIYWQARQSSSVPSASNSTQHLSLENQPSPLDWKTANALQVAAYSNS